MSPEISSQWHQAVAGMLESRSADDAVRELLRATELLVNGNSSMAILYPRNAQPLVCHHRLLANETADTQVGKYVAGAYLLDPFFRIAVHNEAEGLFTLRQVAPDAFEETEYFRVYYRGANLGDEACFLVQGGNGTVASLSIGRAETMRGGRFSESEVAQLTEVFPVVRAVLNRWLDENEAPAASFGEKLDDALEKFGSSVLTNRECEVLHMSMHGHSIKSIAERLGASVDTIKTHRKHIYAKLDVSSQSELFYLFISALRQNPHSGEDPLRGLGETR